MRICIVCGTRPEIIKMSPIIKECEYQGLDYFILHTGQHYSYNLDGVFFEQLGLPLPKYNLNVGSGTDVEEISRILVGVEKVLLEDRCDVVLVEGDTSSVIASALAASKLHIKIGHVEAGLRSYDRQMSEEINRILTDHCSDYLFAPTEKSYSILLGEGIPSDRIFLIGNTIVDVVYNYRGKEKNDQDYILVTLHRQENVDDLVRFSSILDGLKMVGKKFDLPIIFPIHPRAQKMFRKFGLRTNMELIEPVGYFKFLELEQNARLVLTDSGGVQEEVCILGVPCVTLRDCTERPETIEVGANILAGSSTNMILECAIIMSSRDRDWINPFGDGNAGKRIVEILKDTV